MLVGKFVVIHKVIRQRFISYSQFFFASTSDTPISSVVTADFLYLTKADSCVRSHFDKHRVNHLDSHPDRRRNTALHYV